MQILFINHLGLRVIDLRILAGHQSRLQRHVTISYSSILMTESLQDCTDFVSSMFKLLLPKLQHSLLLLDLGFLLADKED